MKKLLLLLPILLLPNICMSAESGVDISEAAELGTAVSGDFLVGGDASASGAKLRRIILDGNASKYVSGAGTLVEAASAIETKEVGTHIETFLESVDEAAARAAIGAGTGTGGDTSYVATPWTYSDETCTAGQYSFDTGYLYACVSSGDINRVALTDWSNPQPVGETCSGDFSSGDNESFESGTLQFCTTDWSYTNADSKLDTYSSTGANCGSTAMAITGNSGNTGDNVATADYGSAISSGYIRFYLTLPTMDDWDYFYFYKASSATTPGVTDSSLSAVVYSVTGTGLRVQLSIGGVLSTNYFELTEGGGPYRVEINYANNATVTMRMWDTDDTTQLQHNGAANDLTETGAAYDTRYHHFYDGYTFAGDATLYIDDVEHSASSWVGARVCD